MKIEGTFEKLDDMYISDGIGDDYKKWHMKEGLKTSSNVFIESPTGTGKTHFIIHKLCSYALKMNRSIIYVCNRDALKKQTQNMIKKSMPELNMIDDTRNKVCVFTSPHSYGVIVIVNYQSIQKLDTFYLNNLFYVVFDEAHFFLEDSVFNVRTYDIYQYMLRIFERQVHIFISATLLGFYELFNVSLEALLPMHLQQEISNALRTIDCVYYHNIYSQSAYNIILYNNDSFLFDAIKKSENSKWLYFVSSKKQGYSAKLCLEMITSKKCIFLTSNDKNRKVWKTLIQENRFEEDVLIATSVIDNGISIHDDSVKNIVLPFCDRTEFLQMLGRRRLEANFSSQINVYVKIPTIQSINKKLRELSSKLAFEYIVTKPSSDQYKRRLIKNYWCSDDYNKLFSIKFKDKNIFIYNNSFATYKFYQEASFYEYLKDSHANTQAYMDCLHLWLNEKKRISNEKIYSDKDNLIDFLDDNAEKNISNQEIFYESFLELYKIFCYNKFMRQDPPKTEQYTAALSIRKGSTQRKATINRSLKFLDLPYKLDKKNNYWILHKLPQ